MSEEEEKKNQPLVSKERLNVIVGSVLVIAIALWVFGYILPRDVASIALIVVFIYFYYAWGKKFLEKKINYSNIDHEKEIPLIEEKLARMGWIGKVYKTEGEFKRGERGGEPILQWYQLMGITTPIKRYFTPRPFLVKVNVLTRSIIDIEPDTRHIWAPGSSWSGSDEYPFAKKEKASIYVPQPRVIEAKMEDEDDDKVEEPKESGKK